MKGKRGHRPESAAEVIAAARAAEAESEAATASNGEPETPIDVQPIGDVMRSAIDRIEGSTEAYVGAPNASETDTRKADVMGGIVIDPEKAAAQLLELAEIQKGVLVAEDEVEQCKEDLKEAKEILEKKVKFLQDKLFTFTHNPSLPLVDGHAREADQQAMLAADEEARAEADGMPPADEIDVVDEPSETMPAL